ncbi:hypothetical protein DRQ25_10615 [Candidatus Fermentibacteria bacterium]|nr:MAG: hypothetical protein DRQ25_10615 [Candidatus Fermentibacteria bacterium]
MILRNYRPSHATITGTFVDELHGSVEVVKWTAKGKILERKDIYRKNTLWFFKDTGKKIPTHKIYDLAINIPF